MSLNSVMKPVNEPNYNEEKYRASNLGYTKIIKVNNRIRLILVGDEIYQINKIINERD